MSEHPVPDGDEPTWVAAARNDPARFGPLYERYHKPVFLFVLKRVHDRDLCGDLTAQVFLKAMLALPKYQERGTPFKAWLYRIALNEVLMHFRHHRGKQYLNVQAPQAMALVAAARGEGSPVDRGTDQSSVDSLSQAMAALSPAQATLVELRFFDGLSFAEVGQVLGIGEDAAKMRTHRVLRILRTQWQGEGPNDHGTA